MTSAYACPPNNNNSIVNFFTMPTPQRLARPMTALMFDFELPDGL
jgi:hypothetical protein